MAEWLIAPVLKTGIVLGTIEGSNPSLSYYLLQYIGFFICCSLLAPYTIHSQKRIGSARWNSRARTEKNSRTV